MTTHSTNKTIKSTIHAFLPDAKVFLFGSRARGSYTKDSDFDVLIITVKTIADRTKINWESKIHEALVEAMNAPFDVTINSEREVAYKKQIHGHYLYNAMKEAIEI